MQVPADPSPLFLAQLDDPLPRRLQVARELDGVNGGGNLRRKVGHEPVVSLAEALARTGCQEEISDACPLMNERERRGFRSPGLPYSATISPATAMPTYCRASVSPSVSTVRGRTASSCSELVSVLPSPASAV